MVTLPSAERVMVPPRAPSEAWIRRFKVVSLRDSIVKKI